MALSRTTNLACLILALATLASTAVMGLLPISAVHHHHQRATTASIHQPVFRRDVSVFSQVPSYEERAASFGMADKEDLAKMAKLKGVVFVDARGHEEIAEASLDKPFVHGNFILRGEMEHVHQILPSKSAPIIVFCKMGGRAAKVKAGLEAEGYTNVLNAGGLGDVDFLD